MTDPGGCEKLKKYTYAKYRCDFEKWAEEKQGIPGAKDWKEGKLEGPELCAFAEEAAGKALLARGNSIKRRNGNGWKYTDAEPLLQETGVYEIARKGVEGLPCPFDAQHYAWCKKVCEKAEKEFENWSYGRSAKLINVFLKALMPANLQDLPAEEKAKWYAVHPPIDGNVLQGMKSAGIGKTCCIEKTVWNWLKKETGTQAHGTWTKFKYEHYLEVICMIRRNLIECGRTYPLPLWKNERFFNL